MSQSPADRPPAIEAALEWYTANGRALAFRRTTDPWAVLVSEVMAQQTQAARAAEAWSTFIERYPDPAALAAASSAEVIRAWRGLGYNRRAIALRSAAVRIVDDHGGAVPDSLDALEALPGIGSYTARAVLAIAFGRPVAPLDTNIRRVLERAIGGLPLAPRHLQATADGFVPPDRSGAWTHALMDIGATFCRKRDPRCATCPLAAHCRLFRAGGLRAAVQRNACATRSAKAKPRTFESTTRYLRGRILDRLRDAAPSTWVAFDGRIGSHDAGAVRRALADLEREGFLELDVDQSRDGRGPRRARLHGG